MHKYLLFLWTIGLGLFSILSSRQLILTVSIIFLLSLNYYFSLSKVNMIQKTYQNILFSYSLIHNVIETKFNYEQFIKKIPRKIQELCFNNHLSLFENMQVLADYFPSDTLDIFLYSWIETGDNFFQLTNYHKQYLWIVEFEKNRLQDEYGIYLEKLQNYLKPWLGVFLFLIVSVLLLSKFYTYLNGLPFSDILWLFFEIFPLLCMLFSFLKIQNKI